MITVKQLEQLMQAKSEHEHLEFKEAKNTFEFDKLVKYCSALANEGGGQILLGITNNTPRQIVGSAAFDPIERTTAGLIQQLRIKVDAQELSHPKGRVVIFTVPACPIGMPIGYKGAYYMRAGEDLVPITGDRLKRIFDQGVPDFSSERCKSAPLDVLDKTAIEKFRRMWIKKSGNQNLQTLSPEALLKDAELIMDDELTYAALVLFGTKKALGKYLAQAEIVYEYRSDEASLSYQQRKEYREGFFLSDDDIIEQVNLRNDTQSYQTGLVILDIPTFELLSVREALLNAVCHRDYRLPGSIFIRQYPKVLEITSPGGFPPGITAENILDRQAPRNRRIAETFAKCGLVERSGQGANRMFEECIKTSKPLPDFSGTDDFQVSLKLRGEVQDPAFLRFLEKVGQQTLSRFTTQDLLVLDRVRHEQPIPEFLKPRLLVLRDLGIVETVGKGKGTKCILSRSMYSFIGKKGEYTRRRGLDREANKALVLTHLERFKVAGIQELQEALPSQSRKQIHSILQSLRQEGRVAVVGERKGAKWKLKAPVKSQ